ncbi:MAG: hypothetical protein V4584_15920 [Verrucomicrobiota bacterium]
MSGDEIPRSGRGCLAWAMWSLGGITVAFFFLLAAARNAWLVELPFHLVAGCVLHANRAASHFATDLPRLMGAAVFPCLASAVALGGAHRLILWWRVASGKTESWHFKHTALAGSLVLLGSAAAIALSGVVHEAVWLPQGKIIQSNHRTALTLAVSNARQLGLMIYEHEIEHGTFPQSLPGLKELAGDSVNLPRMMFVELDPQVPPEPFVLVNPGGTMGRDPNAIVMIGPQMPEHGDFVVLKADNSVTRQPAAKFVEVVRSAAGVHPVGK